MAKTKVTHAPYLDGNLLDWVSAAYPNPISQWPYKLACEWRENVPFEAKMTYEGFGRGQSSTKFYWLDEQGRKYPMFVSDMDALLKAGKPLLSTDGGAVYVSGTWMVAKKGSNFGIKLVTE